VVAHSINPATKSHALADVIGSKLTAGMRPHHNSGAFVEFTNKNRRFYGSDRKTLADVTADITVQVRASQLFQWRMLPACDLQETLFRPLAQIRLRVCPELLVEFSRIVQIAFLSSLFDGFQLCDLAFQH